MEDDEYVQPAIRYAQSDESDVAYQILGNGEPIVLFVPSWESNLDVIWEEPRISRFLTRLAKFARLILFDKRGTGLSSPLPLNAMPTLEQWTDDVTTVLDAAEVDKAVHFRAGRRRLDGTSVRGLSSRAGGRACAT